MDPRFWEEFWQKAPLIKQDELNRYSKYCDRITKRFYQKIDMEFGEEFYPQRKEFDFESDWEWNLWYYEGNFEKQEDLTWDIVARNDSPELLERFRVRERELAKQTFLNRKKVSKEIRERGSDWFDWNCFFNFHWAERAEKKKRSRRKL